MPPFRPTNSETARFHQRYDNTLTALKPTERGGPAVINRIGQGNVMATHPYTDANWKAEHPTYPDYVYPDDKERDTYYNAKIKGANELGLSAVGANIVLPYDDGMVKYSIDKKNAHEMQLFRLFVEDSIPRGSPWARDFFEKIMPGWYQSKMDVIQDKLSIVNRFIDITIRGVQNIDDMFLLYQLYTGKIELPKTFEEVVSGSAGQKVIPNNYVAGLFNPSKWTTNQVSLISLRNQMFMANFAIPGIDIKGLTANNAATNGGFNIPIASSTAANAFLTAEGIELDPTAAAGNGFFPMTKHTKKLYGATMAMGEF